MLIKIFSLVGVKLKEEKISILTKIYIIGLLISIIILWNESVSFSESTIYMLKGISSEDVHYTYTINQDFTSKTSATVNVPILPIFNTPIQSQNSQNQTITYSIQPNTTNNFSDQFGNEYIKAEWPIPITTVQTIMEADVSISTQYKAFITSSSYPIDPYLITSDLALYLQPDYFRQSDDPQIISLATSLVENSSSQTDAVIRIINWVRYNIAWGCPTDIPNFQSDALWTLINKKGNCVNFSNLAIALLRAAGIPAREVFGGIVNNSPSNTSHSWVEVYYPDQGWVQHESSYWMPNEGPLPRTILTPRHVKFLSSPDSMGSPGISSTEHFNEQHQTITTITSSPSLVQSDSCLILPNESATYVLTVKNNNSNSADTFLINAIAEPNTWSISLSQNLVFIDPNQEWGNTRDIGVTISPPANTSVGGSVIVTITATSQNTNSSNDVILQVISAILPYAVNTDPAGLQIIVDGSTYTAPEAFSWPPGSTHTLFAPSPQNGTFGTRYDYSSWSDEGAQTHTVTVPSSSTLYTANFSTTTEAISTPDTPSGPTSGTTGRNYTYSTGGSFSSLGHPVEYQFDWKGDGSELSSWGSASQSKTWNTAGMNGVRARARCKSDTTLVSNWSGTLSVNISNPTLTILKSGTGSGSVTSSPAGINCGSDCSESYDQGTSVTLTATPASGSTFNGWSGGGCLGTGTCVVVMDADIEVTAAFSAKPPAISVSPTSLEFGIVAVGKKITKTLKIANNGSKNLIITISGLEGTDFSIQGSSSVTIKAKKSYSLKVLCMPTTGGIKTAILEIQSSDPDTAPLEISLTATLPATTPEISVTQTSIEFKSIKVGKKATKTIKITNKGSGDLWITLSGLEETDFSIQGSSSVTIKAKKSYSLKVLFTPESAGLETATLEITSNDPDTPTIDISLSGTGQ